MMSQINYSIIVPHKNAPDLLEHCLSTIPVRDDVQVIVVDDNSDASKVDFEHFPKWEGTNYEYYLTKEGKGGGYARNVGLEHTIGKWVLFLDADDYLQPSIGAIMDEEVNTDADLIYFRPKAVMQEDHSLTSTRADVYNMMIDEYFQTKDENNIRTRFFVPWTKFVRKSLIDSRSIRFDELPYSNDVVCSVIIGCYAKTICVRDTSFYVVTQSKHSLTTGMFRKPHELEARTVAFFDAAKIIYDNGYRIDEAWTMNYLGMQIRASRKDIIRYYRVVRSFGYKRMEIIRKLYKKNDWKAHLKRLYVFFVTLFEN